MRERSAPVEGLGEDELLRGVEGWGGLPQGSSDQGSYSSLFCGKTVPIVTVQVPTVHITDTTVQWNLSIRTPVNNDISLIRTGLSVPGSTIV